MTPRFNNVSGLFIIALHICVSPALASPWADSREQQRIDRHEFVYQLNANRGKRAQVAYERLVRFVDEIEKNQWRYESRAVWGLCAGLEGIDRDRLGNLPERLRNLDSIDPDTHEKPAPGFTEALVQVRSDLTEPTYQLLQRAAAVGEVQLAVELMREILRFDPDHQAIRKALGQVKRSLQLLEDEPNAKDADAYPDQSRIQEIQDYDPDEEWFSPFDAKALDAGMVWNPNRGWMPIKYADRYAKGYIYDQDRRKWTSLREANAYHSKPGRDWVIQTEHLIVSGTADLESMAQVATQLEELYDEIFWVYASFFADGRRYDPLRLALGLVEHRPLKVWVYATRDEYISRADAVRWSAGIFRPSKSTSYFYGGPSGTMYHEFTHQVLHVMTGKNRSPAWLTEAIAVYTQTVEFDGPTVSFRGAPYSGRLPLQELFALVSGAAWYRHVESDLPSSYAEAGSVATFCMQAHEGRFRADFIDFLRDSYRGNDRGKNIWDYLGLSQKEFRKAYHLWGHRE